MTVTLLINGEQVDFEATMKQIFKQAYAEMSVPTSYTPEFVIDPDHFYAISDERVHKLFGVNGSKQPDQSIIKRLRKLGIEPIKRGGSRGSVVFGHQINDYFMKLSASQTDYLNKN